MEIRNMIDLTCLNVKEHGRFKLSPLGSALMVAQVPKGA